jgi:hypothetical protein
MPVVSAATGKICRLRPFDLWVERPYCRRNIAAVECGVGFTEEANGVFLLCGGFHPSLPSRPVAAGRIQAQNRNGDDSWKSFHADEVERRRLITA